MPKETLLLVDKAAQKGGRSRLIGEAIEFYIGKASRARMRKRLKEGAVMRASRDLRLSEEWFVLDD